ncbi:MAG TPA: SAM-dependent methyltransferase [Candidatus Lustribacter sp.]|nr:SAM-dependent methyltransferase [Candidatus Lustribacter sp.]
MLVELRPTERLRKGDGAVVQSVLGSILHAVSDESLDLDKLRIVCDWVQYKNNFRDEVEIRPILNGSATEYRMEIGVDLRRASAANHDVRAEMARALARRNEPDRHYLEPWCRTTASMVWSFNALYWKALPLWEAVSGRPYEQALPGGESDARNAAAARDTIGRLFAMWDRLAERRALPDQLHVLEIGVGNGNQARVWLDTFLEIDRETGREYYRRLHYLMGDYSPHLLEVARAQLQHHEEHMSTIVLDATKPLNTLGFLKYKTFFIYISNVYDNLPTDEIARIDGHLFQVETRAFLGAEAAATIAAGIGAGVADLPDLIARLLRLGPELLADTEPRRFADAPAAVRFWMAVWEALGLEERYVALPPLDEYEFAPGINGEVLRPLMEANGDVRMHVSNGAAASFVDTLPLLHPHGILECHDIFVTTLDGYSGNFRGPGKYEGSVVNWVNGNVLAALGGRRGFDVVFRKFAFRSGSNITTMTAEVRE